MTDASEQTLTPATEPVAPPAAAPSPASSPRVGQVALIAAVILAIGSLALSVVLGFVGAPYVDRTSGVPSFNFQFGDPDPVVSTLGILSPLHAFGGALIGGWVIIQSIVAIAANRGRRQGIIALILAVVTPGVSLVVYLLIMFLPR